MSGKRISRNDVLGEIEWQATHGNSKVLYVLPPRLPNPVLLNVAPVKLFQAATQQLLAEFRLYHGILVVAELKFL